MLHWERFQTRQPVRHLRRQMRSGSSHGNWKHNLLCHPGMACCATVFQSECIQSITITNITKPRHQAVWPPEPVARMAVSTILQFYISPGSMKLLVIATEERSGLDLSLIRGTFTGKGVQCICDLLRFQAHRCPPDSRKKDCFRPLGWI